MTEEVRKLLQAIINDCSEQSEERAILQKILAIGIENLDADEITVFAELILPLIKKNKCECWSCHTDVSGNSPDDIYEFLKIGLCPVCNENDWIRDAASL